MTLVKCRDCGKEVSDNAKACIHCGCPIGKRINCQECGQEISSLDSACPYCGCPVNIVNTVNSVDTVKTDNYAQRIESNESSNSTCIAGLIFGGISFFLDFWGLVAATGLTLSIVGLNKAKKHKDKTMAIIGIVLSSIELLFKIIQVITLISNEL